MLERSTSVSVMLSHVPLVCCGNEKREGKYEKKKNADIIHIFHHIIYSSYIHRYTLYSRLRNARNGSDPRSNTNRNKMVVEWWAVSERKGMSMCVTASVVPPNSTTQLDLAFLPSKPTPNWAHQPRNTAQPELTSAEAMVSWTCDGLTISYASLKGTNRCRRCKLALASGSLRLGVSTIANTTQHTYHSHSHTHQRSGLPFEGNISLRGTRIDSMLSYVPYVARQRHTTGGRKVLNIAVEICVLMDWWILISEQDEHLV